MAVRRRRYSGTIGSFSGAIKTVSTSGGDAVAKQVDKFVQMLTELRDRESFTALASKDPKTFLAYAEPRLSKMDKTDPNYILFTDLIKGAKDKIEEEQWAEDVKSGIKTLEDLQSHLYKKLEGMTKGSPDASKIIGNIAAVQRSIVARGENERDHDALLEYTQTRDHMKYADYLRGKLYRTTDSQAQSQIASAIETLYQRDQKEKDLAAAKAKAANAGRPAGGRAPSATQSANETKFGGEVGKALLAFDAWQTRVSSKIERGEALTPEDIRGLKKAAGDAYNAHKTAASQLNDPKKAYDEYSEALKVEQDVSKALSKAAKATLGDLDLTSKGLAATRKDALSGANPTEEAKKILSEVAFIRGKLDFLGEISPGAEKAAREAIDGPLMTIYRDVVNTRVFAPWTVHDAAFQKQYNSYENNYNEWAKSIRDTGGVPPVKLTADEFLNAIRSGNRDAIVNTGSPLSDTGWFNLTEGAKGNTPEAYKNLADISVMFADQPGTPWGAGGFLDESSRTARIREAMVQTQDPVAALDAISGGVQSPDARDRNMTTPAPTKGPGQSAPMPQGNEADVAALMAQFMGQQQQQQQEQEPPSYLQTSAFGRYADSKLTDAMDYLDGDTPIDIPAAGLGELPDFGPLLDPGDTTPTGDPREISDLTANYGGEYTGMPGREQNIGWNETTDTPEPEYGTKGPY
jgi:hypothetical protein